MPIRRAVFWLLDLVLGVGLGLLLLEAMLHLNPGLLLRGMALPAPADAPITTQKYTVKYSDADLFYWQADEIQPLNPEDDRIEAEVIYQTDEFGFHNIPPSGTKAEIVVFDLPMPGSPPRSTSDPGTSPPPRTRSTSRRPMTRRSVSCAATSFSATTAGAATALRRAAARGPFDDRLDERVPAAARAALAFPAQARGAARAAHVPALGPRHGGSRRLRRRPRPGSSR